MLPELFPKLPVAARQAARRALLFGAAVAAMLASPAVAHAQLDTPAASDARAALRAVEATYGKRTEWSQWSTLLKLPDVRYELRAGERAEAAALRAAILELLGGRVPQFVEPPLARLAKALDLRAQELETVPASDWPSACRNRALAYAPVTPEDVEQARAEFERRMDQFERHFPAIRIPTSRWGAFLHWPESRALAAPASAGPPDAELLDRLETRWGAATDIWDDDVLFDASLAARSYIHRLRAYLQGETREQHAAAWNELADLLDQFQPQDQDTSKIAAAVIGRERLDQASPLTGSIRRALSRPNLIVQARTKWLESQFAGKFDEPYDVDGVFAGTRSVGRGRTVGTTQLEIRPSTAVGQWLLRIRGTSTARARGSQERVSVASRSTTRVSGTKPLVLDARGLTVGPGSAGATTSIVYENIDAPGRAFRRNAAINETYARRPQAEAESAAYARRSLLEQINTEGDRVAAEFNRSYHARLRDPRIHSNRPAPDVRVVSSDGAVRWECLLEGPHTFAAGVAPPEYDPGTEVVMSLAASALEEQGVVTLGGRDMTSRELLESLGPAAGEPAEKGGDEFNVTFEADPCDIRFEDDVIHARLHIMKFASADVNYPAMTVNVAYKPLERDGKVVFVRQGRLRVTPPARSDGEAPVLSGRQQTLRLAVERKLGKVLSEELLFSSVTLPLSEDEEAKLRIERARVVAPWLQIGLAPEPKS